MCSVGVRERESTTRKIIYIISSRDMEKKRMKGVERSFVLRGLAPRWVGWTSVILMCD
jgi:hypothetical protein